MSRVSDVNYGGSTGYGRDYRQRLQGQWGIVDVQDTIACVEYLVSKGWVDGKRVSTTGGSAGMFGSLLSERRKIYSDFCSGRWIHGVGSTMRWKSVWSWYLTVRSLGSCATS